MVITSSIEGRIRIRDHRLKQANLLEKVRETLLQRPEIREISCNQKTGSLLVLYRKGRQNFTKITDLLSQLLGSNSPSENKAASPNPHSHPQKISRRRILNFGMLTTLLASLLAITASKGIHIITGLHFLGFLAFHLFDKRRTLFI